MWVGKICKFFNKVLGDIVEKATDDIVLEIVSSATHALSEQQIDECLIVRGSFNDFFKQGFAANSLQKLRLQFTSFDAS
jgi:hypothetical protein